MHLFVKIPRATGQYKLRWTAGSWKTEGILNEGVYSYTYPCLSQGIYLIALVEVYNL